MTRITVAHGGSRDAAFPVSVNGEIIIIQAGIEQDVPAAYVEAIQHTYGLFSTVLVDSPEGLPEGAIAFADFKNGTYHYGGNALSDFLVDDPDWNDWNPASVVAGVGLEDFANVGGATPTLAPVLTTDLLASGFSAILTYARPSADPGAMTFEILELPDFTVEWIFEFLLDNDDSRIRFPSVSENLIDTNQSTGTHKGGMTMQANNDLIMVVDGISTGVVTPPATGVNSIAFQVFNQVSIERIVFYPPKTEAELIALTT